MSPKKIWDTLDTAGLVPSVPWTAAPSEWRDALLNACGSVDEQHEEQINILTEQKKQLSEDLRETTHKIQKAIEVLS